METLGRWAGWLAVAGGALLAVMLVVVVLTNPATSPAWNLFWVVVALLGAGVLGLYERTRSAVGQLGRVSAWVSAFGGLGLLLVGVYAIATNQLDSGQSGSDPLWPFWIVTFGAWLVGNLGFAVALIRARSPSSLGAWLVVAGAVIGLAASLFGGANPPAALLLLFALFGAGWIVVGYEATREGDTMRTLTIDQYVAAPIERVYAAYVDPVLMPRWMELQAVTDLSGPLDRAGTRFTQIYRGAWRFRAEVLRADPPILHEMAGRAPLATTYRWLARFAPESEGTRVTLESEWRAFGRLDPLLEKVFALSARGDVRRHLATLAAVVEAGS